ncbi:HD domain-containing protein [Cronobacter muytjensii]
MVFNIGNTLIFLCRTKERFRNNLIFNGVYASYIAYRLSLMMEKSNAFCLRALICGLLQGYTTPARDNKKAQDEENPSLNNIQRVELSDCSVFESFSTPTRYRFYDYDLLKALAISQEDILISSVLKISNDFDLFLHKSRLYEKLENERSSALQASSLFDEFAISTRPERFYPGLMDELRKLTELDDFWFYLRADYIEGMIRTINFDKSLPVMNDEHTLSLARLLSTIVDMKNPLTYHHSLKVGELASFIGKKMYLDERTCNRLYLAGLLHDLGKINTADGILNKCGKLTPGEYRTIQRHVTDTRGILRSIIIDESVVDWAAEHHERIDGSGYPMKKRGEQLSLPSRIMAIADIFQALCQKRTYREALPLDKVLSIIRTECANGKICSRTFSVFEENAKECYEIAK